MIDLFWETKPLKNLTQEEWEALCDRCGWCCLHKFEDDEGEVRYTNIACKYFDMETCNCTQYTKRSVLVKECVKLTPEKTDKFSWLPPSCAYRLIHNGEMLAKWHPLISGNTKKMSEEGINIQSFAISENDINMDDIEDYIEE